MFPQIQLLHYEPRYQSVRGEAMGEFRPLWSPSLTDISTVNLQDSFLQSATYWDEPFLLRNFLLICSDLVLPNTRLKICDSFKKNLVVREVYWQIWTIIRVLYQPWLCCVGSWTKQRQEEFPLDTDLIRNPETFLPKATYSTMDSISIFLWQRHKEKFCFFIILKADRQLH